MAAFRSGQPTINPRKKSNVSAMAIASVVLAFWFGEPDSPDYGKPKKFWFQSTPQLDQQIRDEFKSVYQQALKGDLDTLMQTPEGSLALVIILDQFPRNMFRGTAQAFASDQKALNVAQEALAEDFDQQLLPIQRAFLYLPFEHSENLEDQERSVALFQELGDAENLKYAIDHRDTIAQFGRFPHRNAILNRESTKEEIEFLEKPGVSGFGQTPSPVGKT